MNGVRFLIMSKITVQRGRSSQIKRTVFKSRSKIKDADIRSRQFGKRKVDSIYRKCIFYVVAAVADRVRATQCGGLSRYYTIAGIKAKKNDVIMNQKKGKRKEGHFSQKKRSMDASIIGLGGSGPPGDYFDNIKLDCGTVQTGFEKIVRGICQEITELSFTYLNVDNDNMLSVSKDYQTKNRTQIKFNDINCRLDVEQGVRLPMPLKGEFFKSVQVQHGTGVNGGCYANVMLQTNVDIPYKMFLAALEYSSLYGTSIYLMSLANNSLMCVIDPRNKEKMGVCTNLNNGFQNKKASEFREYLKAAYQEGGY